MTLAVIKTGGKQYIVTPGQKLKIEKLPKEVGDEIIFDQVLLVSNDLTRIGHPVVKDVEVKGKVLSQGKGKKITILKFKPKVRYHKKAGHRQLYTEVEITQIA
ncbi:MAG: 50S ribosomal protein L21 [Candidatus Wildermuthbacteria bacterium GWA2_46_15]|uniref:Large ribosomal subunit protein bL21 n=1 Tax=Candidatus Wildermuthbacteria bacterium GWA2_46_15 TaxID=1802443 RepID=A0A1G2QR13_9BACT|nr:MAG: 50S ribosomal protein L21 [Candidatus Wildermuthbacteria bacterium GWA2_46_15]